MRKIGIPILLASAIIASATVTRPAHATDPATGAAIATAAIAGLVTILTLKCTDANKDEYLCIAGPPKPPKGPEVVCGTALIPCQKNPATGKVVVGVAPYSPKNYLEDKAIKVVQSYYPNVRAGKLKIAAASRD